jgi:hypothetical protein
MEKNRPTDEPGKIETRENKSENAEKSVVTEFKGRLAEVFNKMKENELSFEYPRV